MLCILLSKDICLPCYFWLFLCIFKEESDKGNQTLPMFLKDLVDVINCPYFHVCMKLLPLNCLDLFWCQPQKSFFLRKTLH